MPATVTRLPISADVLRERLARAERDRDELVQENADLQRRLLATEFRAMRAGMTTRTDRTLLLGAGCVIGFWLGALG